MIKICYFLFSLLMISNISTYAKDDKKQSQETLNLVQVSINFIHKDPSIFYNKNRIIEGRDIYEENAIEEREDLLKKTRENLIPSLIIPFYGMGNSIKTLQHSVSQFNKGVFAFRDDNDYTSALKFFKNSDEKENNAAAQYNVGFMYQKGLGVVKSNKEAAIWYRKAAEQGFADAQFNLGLLYDNGQGEPQNKANAAHWYHEAAKQGIAEAQNNLGIMYATGQGVGQDYDEAVTWFLKSAEQKNIFATVNLGFTYLLKAYLRQEKIGQNFNSAIYWFEKAKNLPESHEFQETLYKHLENKNSIFYDAIKNEKNSKPSDLQKILRFYLQMVAHRGLTTTPLAITKQNLNQILQSETYVIVLPEEGQILYPITGNTRSEIALREGERIKIDIEKIAQKNNDMLSINLKLYTDFLVNQIIFEGAELSIEYVMPDYENPETIFTSTSVTLDKNQFSEYVTLTIISREGHEHMRSLILSDEQSEVISPADVMLD